MGGKGSGGELWGVEGMYLWGFLFLFFSGLRGLYLYYSTVAVLRVFPGTALSKWFSHESHDFP